MTTDLLPVFVYGTLRNGFGNYEYLLRGNTVHEQAATLSGATMHDNGGFPFVAATGTGTVVGEIMHLDPATARRTLARLDSLEGFFGEDSGMNMYDRVRTEVTTADGETVTVWAYVASAGMYERRVAGLPVVASGDWKSHKALARF